MTDLAALLRIPSHYSDVCHEWTALSSGAGVIDGGCRDLLRLRGGDRTTFLQGMITNDVVKTTAGTGVYAAMLTIQGRIVADMNVLVLAEEIWLDLPAGAGERVRGALDKFIIADDVEFADDEAVALLLAVQGPTAARILVGVLGESFDDLGSLAHRAATFEGQAMHVARVSLCGAAGFYVFGPPAAGQHLWERCVAAGADAVGAEALNVARIEAGIPWCDVDFDESTLIGEAEIEAAISFRKGCYLGQEVVERVAARGQVQRKRVALRLAAPQVPDGEIKLFAAEKDVGRVTSVVQSLATNAVIGMGYVRREVWEPGTSLRGVADSWSGEVVVEGLRA